MISESGQARPVSKPCEVVVGAGNEYVTEPPADAVSGDCSGIGYSELCSYFGQFIKLY